MKLSWLPEPTNWSATLSSVRGLAPDEAARSLVALANCSIDFLQTNKLDRTLQALEDPVKAHLQRTKPVRLALIGSSTLTHLVPAIRVAALRRGFLIDVFEGHYGMYHQELADSSSDLYAFKPDLVLLALDAHHVAGGEHASAPQTMRTIETCWQLAKEQLGATVLQQTILPVFPPLLGNNEQRYPGSPFSVIAEVNQKLRSSASSSGVHLLSVDTLALNGGIAAWHDPALWHRAKQEISPIAAPLYGDHAGRFIAALRGLSSKCLVLDLDNTLWGGVIGDDGLEGILLGQGHAVGEAHTAFQKYAKQLAARGVILAVCSKNDDANARAAFESHPEMHLRLPDIACFVANWQDKATNLRSIAKSLNIGLDSLVFADDNPFERNLVRQELPMVAVPELGDDPALYIDAIAQGGYFEALTVTGEDLERGQQYQANAERERTRESATDMASYLAGLEMKLRWSAFDAIGLGRIAQLINKSNQFNLTTRRYTEGEVSAMANTSSVLTLQLRLTDRYGDNGMIAVVIGKLHEETLEIDTWLMSCRVLGRQVEEATLNLLVERAAAMGAKELLGCYLPTAKNSMVREHYGRLGFSQKTKFEDGGAVWSLRLDDYAVKPTYIETVEGAIDAREDLRAAH